MMRVTRLDLDGTGSPAGLVTKILKAEPSLPIPIPIEELAIQLDIGSIEELETDGFEGGLVTDNARSSGVVLVNRNVPLQRRRFTIGHELGHFLIPTHRPVQTGSFLCSREDMRCWTAAENDRYARMETDANKFAALILMPPPFLKIEMQRYSDPDLQHVPQLARRFCVSKETAARAYAEFNDEAIAIIVTKDGTINRAYKNLKFPRILPSYGQAVPRDSLFHRAKPGLNIASNIEPTRPETWIEADLRLLPPTLYEQIYPQQDGYGLLLLHLVAADDEEEQEERELQNSWQIGFGRRSRR